MYPGFWIPLMAALARHFERGQEPLFGENPRKKRFLIPQTPFEMTDWEFFRTLLSRASVGV